MSKMDDFLKAAGKLAAEKENKKREKKASVGGDETETAAAEGQAPQKEARKEDCMTNHAPKIRGRAINRRMVFGLAGICLTAFLASFLYFSGDRAKTPPPQVETSEQTARSNMPDNYVAMSKKDEQFANKNKPKAKQSPANQTAAQVGRRTDAPMIAGPPQAAAATNVQAAPDAQKKQEEKRQAEIFSAAISFSLASNPSAKEAQAGGAAAGSALPAAAAARRAPVESALYAGTLLPAMLMSGASTDLGGQITAQITANIYDTLHGDTLLIPMGSRLIGAYQSGAETGQSRIAVDWTTLVMPDGATYDIGGYLVSSDEAGYPGIPGEVDNHTDKALTGGALSSAIAALGSIAVGNTGSGNDESAGKLAMEGAAANLLNSASALFNKNINIKPTVTIAPGETFAVRVSQTLKLDACRQ